MKKLFIIISMLTFTQKICMAEYDIVDTGVFENTRDMGSCTKHARLALMVLAGGFGAFGSQVIFLDSFGPGILTEAGKFFVALSLYNGVGETFDIFYRCCLRS